MRDMVSNQFWHPYKMLEKACKGVYPSAASDVDYWRARCRAFELKFSAKDLDFCDDYQWYINSPTWRYKRALMLEINNHRCEMCKATRNLEVHHWTYDNLGKERPTELSVLCQDCHRNADERRREMQAERRMERLYRKRLSGWAKKVYGENWIYKDLDIEREFEEWLERKGYDDDY